MRQPEQMTINEIVGGGFTLGDLAIYGGLIAVGAAIGMYLTLRYVGRGGG